MSHASDGEEIVSTPGGVGSATISSAMSHSNVDDIYESLPSPRLHISSSVGDSNPWSNTGTGATGSITPTNVTATPSLSTLKKRKASPTDREKLEIVRVVLLEIAEAKIHGSFKKGTRKTKTQILQAHGMTESQLTRWQQYCYICCSFFKSMKEAFSCDNKKCTMKFCKSCVGNQVVQNLTLELFFRPVSRFQCMTCRVDNALHLSLATPVDETRKNALIDSMRGQVKTSLKENNGRLALSTFDLCLFRFRLKVNYEERFLQLFTPKETRTVNDFLSLWGRFSGVKVDNNEIKCAMKEIEFSLGWIASSFGADVQEERDEMELFEEQYEGWFASMIDFGLKCHGRMKGLKSKSLCDIESLPFWEGLERISPVLIAAEGQTYMIVKILRFLRGYVFDKEHTYLYFRRKLILTMFTGHSSSHEVTTMILIHDSF